MAIDLQKLELSEKGGDTNRLLDMLISMEDILDASDCYVGLNWLDGEIIDGPIIRRHWVSMSLLYPHNKMPDPRYALRLLKLDIMVEFSKVHQSGKEFHPLVDETSVPERSEKAEKEHEEKNWFWMVKLTYPRRLIDQVEGDQFDFYDEDDGVDVEDVESAKDSGIDAETGYESGDGESSDQDQDQGMGGDENPFETPGKPA